MALSAERRASSKMNSLSRAEGILGFFTLTGVDLDISVVMIPQNGSENVTSPEETLLSVTFPYHGACL